MSLEHEKIISDWDTLAQAYDEKFAKIRIYDSSYHAFLNFIQGSNILDIGCGPGTISEYLIRADPNLKIDAIDSSSGMIKYAKLKNSAVNYVVHDAKDIRRLGFNYNGIIAGFCLPYLTKEETKQFIKDMSTCGKQACTIYISTHYSETSRTMIQKSSEGKIQMKVHFHDYKVLEDEFSQNGLEILYKELVEYDNHGGIEEHVIYILRCRNGINKAE